MTPWQIFCFVAGLGTGLLHAASVWHSARHRASWAAAVGVLRLLLVALVVTAAALTGGLIPAGVGWGLGFLAAAAAVLLRSRPA